MECRVFRSLRLQLHFFECSPWLSTCNMTDLQQRPYVPARQPNSQYPVCDPPWIFGNQLTGFRSSSTVIRTYLRLLVHHWPDNCPVISSELSNMRDPETMSKELLWLPGAPPWCCFGKRYLHHMFPKRALRLSCDFPALLERVLDFSIFTKTRFVQWPWPLPAQALANAWQCGSTARTKTKESWRWICGKWSIKLKETSHCMESRALLHICKVWLHVIRGTLASGSMSSHGSILWTMIRYCSLCRAG